MTYWLSVFVPAATATLWEDFESGNRLTTYNPSGNSGSWSRVLESGDYIYKYTGGSGNNFSWDNADVFNSSDSIYMSAMLRADTSGTNLTGLIFAKPTGSNFNGYQVLIDMRNATGSSSAFQIRKDLAFGGGIVAFDDSITVSASQWYKVEVDWVSSKTTITARLYNDAGTLLSTLTSTDTTYTSGRVGVYSNSPGSFNDIDVSVGSP